jgi:hypothetical protein
VICNAFKLAYISINIIDAGYIAVSCKACGHSAFSALSYTFWCSVNTPELLVVALHQAPSIISGFAFHHSFLISYLTLSLENNMALAETSSFYTTLHLLYTG